VNLPPGGDGTSEDRSIDLSSTSRPSPFAAPVAGGLAGAVLRRALHHIDSHLHEAIPVQTLAALARLSVPHFSRAFSRSMGVSPHRYLMQRRVQRASQLLLDTEQAASEIALLTGFADQSHMIRCFVRETGQTPRAYRRETSEPSARFNDARIGSTDSTFIQSLAVRRHSSSRYRPLITSGESTMSQPRNLAKRSEKGLLTPDNCVLAMIDLQPQMLFGVSNFDRQSVINNNVMLAKASQVFGVPVVLSSVETKAFSGNTWPQILAALPGVAPIERSSMNSWDDGNFVAAIEKSGKKKIVLSGLWTETCVALPTIQAIHDGYEIYVVEDCCGDVSQLSHDNAMKRVIQAGAKPVTALSVMLEWQRDWAQRETYDAVMDIVKTHCGAYGMGVEYAYTMVHGAPPTQLAPYEVPSPHQ
jgi:AraC-like DNA-binding protein/nicotinamidase-related amidase